MVSTEKSHGPAAMPVVIAGFPTTSAGIWKNRVAKDRVVTKTPSGNAWCFLPPPIPTTSARRHLEKSHRWQLAIVLLPSIHSVYSLK